MTGRPKSQGPAKGPRRDILASLKLANIEMSKPVLPAELISTILDYLAPVDLISVAQSSKRMQEMVYDDTRWVRFLKRMGCWNELEARKHAEQTQSNGRRRAPTLTGQAVGRTIPTIQVESKPPGGPAQDTGGFDAVDFTAPAQPHDNSRINPESVLTVLARIRSIRGQAREEYGKIHTALNPYYDDLNRSEVSTNCLVFKNYDDPAQQAQLLAQLQSFAKGDWSVGWEGRTHKLDNVTSQFETAALREFRNGYEAEDIDGLLPKYATVLANLNGGRAAVELFIHHNHIITKKKDFGSPMDCINSATGAVSLEHTQAFFTRLSVAYNEENSIIDRCFSKCEDFSATFLEKVGTDVLSPYFSTLFDEVHAQNINSYLNTVSGTFLQALNFANNLRPIQTAGNTFSEAAIKMVEKTFEPHVDLYLAEELAQFRKHSDAVVSDWDRQLSEHAASTESFFMANIDRRADKKDFLTSFKKVLMAPVNILPGFSRSNDAKPEAEKPSSTIDSLGASNPNRSSTFIVPVSTPITPTEMPTTELAAKAAIMNAKLEGIRSLFSIEVALNLVHTAKSSLERTAQFVKLQGELGQAAKQQCEAIFVSLLDILGRRHVIAGFDKAVEHLSAYNPRHDEEKSDPLVTFLELVNVGDLILQMMDVFYEQELIGAKLTDRSDFLDPAVKEKKKFEQMLDGRVAAGLNKGIDVLLEEVDHTLSTKQTTFDFNPELAEPSQRTTEIGPTDPAKEIVQLLSSHTQMLVGSTDKSTLDVFNQEIGLRLFTALCKHLKRQRISVEGAIRLISDMNHYFGFIQSMKNDELLLYFKALRELSQVYLIDTSHSKEIGSIIADNYRFHGIFRAEEVYDFAERRADWYQVKKDVERAMYGVGCTVM